ncbi:MAG TPA: SGNH hydrolase domain-containing protein, partial [Bryobacteraceae bacterium]|nr:SGNH hydrolase domain-containing protein [Bryobacteraceae bacterium]
TWRYVERPIRESRPAPRLVSVLAASVLVTGAVGFAIYRADGLDFRFRRERRIVAALSNYDYFSGTTERAKWGPESCFILDAPADAFEKRGCATVRHPDRPLAMLIGDSHMAYLSVALKPTLEARGFEVLMLTSSFCPVLREEAVDERCAGINRFLRTRVSALTPSVLVVFGNHVWYTSESEGLKTHYGRDLAGFVRQVQGSGIGRAIVIGQMPLWQRALPSLLARSALRNSGSIPARSFNGVSHQSLDIDATLGSEDFGPRASYFSLRNLLCNSDGCMTMVGPDPEKDLIVYDYGHLTASGARYVTERLLPAILVRPRRR